MRRVKLSNIVGKQEKRRTSKTVKETPWEELSEIIRKYDGSTNIKQIEKLSLQMV